MQKARNFTWKVAINALPGQIIHQVLQWRVLSPGLSSGFCGKKIRREIPDGLTGRVCIARSTEYPKSPRLSTDKSYSEMIDARPILDSDIWSGGLFASLHAVIGNDVRFSRMLEILREPDIKIYNPCLVIHRQTRIQARSSVFRQPSFVNWMEKII